MLKNTKYLNTIRGFSRYSGIPEGLLRKMYHNDQLPGIHSGHTFLINVVKACELFDIPAPTDNTEAN